MRSAREPLDLRLAPAAVLVWGAAAVALGWSPTYAVCAALLLWSAGGVLLVAPWLERVPARAAIAATVVIAGAALASAGLRSDAVQAGPLRSLAAARASVSITANVSGDPVLKTGAFSAYVLVTVTVTSVTSQGLTTRVRSPVLVIGSPAWSKVSYGDRVETFGRLESPQGPDLSAVLIASAKPRVTTTAGRLDEAIGRVRAGLTQAGAALPLPQRALLPALVDGDLSAMPDDTTTEFKTTGLTHLLAVSGSNLTLVLSFVLFAARWLRVRGYGLVLVGVVAVVFFVLLARPQPSVLRAAAMGVVALAGTAGSSRPRGVRVLCVAVVMLLVLDPWLARSVGFLLSTLASGAILVLAPWWRGLLGRWLPAVVAEAVAVPLAAQVACTPVIAAISGQVSLVAVFANLAVAPAVGPATVASLIAGLGAILSRQVGRLVAHVAGIPLWWIVEVARHGADLSGASLSWGAGVGSVALLALLCAAFVAVSPVLLPRRVACVAALVVLMLALLDPLHRLGWPPAGWVMVMCDVGQGDGMVLNAGHGVAVMVDTGPDPQAIRACLDELDVDRVALIVLTHFHSDHVDGLPAVLAGWPVGEIETSPYDVPTDRYHAVLDEAAAAGVPVTVATVGERRRVGQLRWLVIGPPPATADGAGGDEGSGPNNASVVMLLRVEGERILLAGDAQTEEDDALLASGVDLRVDVLKEPHHGSAVQDPRFLAATHAAVSLISVGAGNPYGHPAPQTLAWLEQLHMQVYRTDLDGDIALVVRQGALSVVTSH
jgi:competence protein ComEC